ncbi:MAG TPA: LytTR family DNA-binding domain-containing protein [Bacteroidia bacterium]|nr:LytTR family DNA-binding domain-containing protein [Bacteroidia bacterium]
MNCMIIDDDEMSRRTLNHLVSQAEDLDVEDICNNAIEAMSVLHSKKIDLLLLDIEMPGISGPQLLKSIHKPPLVIVVSSKKESAFQTLGLNIIGYITKPVNPELFFKSVAKAKELCDEVKNEIEFSENDSIFIKNDGNRIQLNLNDILLLEGKFDAINIITENRDYTVNSSISFLEAKLDPQRFIKVHRSFIINLNKISSINDNKITIDERTIPVGDDFKDNFNKRLNLLK